MDTSGIGQRYVSLFPSLVLLSDLGVGGIAATAVSPAQVLVPNEPNSANDVNNAQSSYVFLVQHSATGGGGPATATPYLMTSFDGGTTWMVAAQGTVLNPGDNLFEAIPCQALGQLVGVAWVLTGTPAPTARGKAWIATNDVMTTQVSSAVVATTYATPATSVTPATQAWVTAQLAALTWKAPVRVATAAALPAYTFSAAANTITANANGALPNVDGVALAVGDRVLVKDGAVAADNGIYVVTSLGSVGTPYVLTRASDANVSADWQTGVATIVTAGTVNGNMIFRLTTAGVINLNTTGLAFSSRLSVAAPSADSDAVNLQTFESRSTKTPARVATTTALPAYTRVGNIITANAVGALPNVDGVALVVGDRLLLKDGAAGADNGIYVVTDAGGVGTPFILTRTSDMADSVDCITNATVLINSGTVNGGKQFRLVTGNPITINVTAMTFAATAFVDNAAPSADSAVVNIDVMQAQAWKAPVRVATAVALAAYTRVGNVITANATGALAAIDGVNLVVGDRLLLQNGAAGQDNGIYVVTDLGSAGTPFILTRANDMSVSADVVSELCVVVQDGTINGKKVYQLTTLNPIVLNTTALAFASSLNQVQTTEVNANYVVTVNDTAILMDASGGNRTVTLLDITTRRQTSLDVANVGNANNAVITAAGGQTVAGGATYNVASHKGVRIVAPKAGTDWQVLIGG